MNKQIKAVRQDSLISKNSKIKFSKETLKSQRIISKIYEIEFFENLGIIMTNITIREKGKQDRKETISIPELIQNLEYKGIFEKIFQLIGVVNVGADYLFEKMLHRLSIHFLENDSISDYTLIEYLDGKKELAMQPEKI